MRKDDDKSESTMDVTIEAGEVRFAIDGHVVLSRPLKELFGYLRQTKTEADTEATKAELRARLSWALAGRASNPEYQEWLESKRRENPLFINPLGTTQYPYLFKDGE